MKLRDTNLTIEKDRYENLFTIGTDSDGKQYFNLTESLNLQGTVPDELFQLFIVPAKMSWHNVQYDVYGSLNMWWALFLQNPELNPMEFPYAGQKIKVIRKEFIPSIIQKMNE